MFGVSYSSKVHSFYIIIPFYIVVILNGTRLMWPRYIFDEGAETLTIMWTKLSILYDCVWFICNVGNR